MLKGSPKQPGLILAVIETNRDRDFLVGRLIDGLAQDETVDFR